MAHHDLAWTPSPIVVPPSQAPHRSTIILLHGRGQNAQKFHGPLLQTLVGSCTLREALSHARFVFPTAPRSRATKYARMRIHQWFEGSGDWEPEAFGAMRPSLEYIDQLVRHEQQLLGGDARRLVLAGFSQGGATALSSLLLAETSPLGAVVSLCGFVPLCAHLTSILDQGDEPEPDDDVFERREDAKATTPTQRVLEALRDEAEVDAPMANSSAPRFLSTPVLLAHGAKDPEVHVQQAVNAARLLKRLGMDVTLRVYQHLGHRYSAEMLCDLVQFLGRHIDEQDPTPRSGNASDNSRPSIC